MNNDLEKTLYDVGFGTVGMTKEEYEALRNRLRKQEQLDNKAYEDGLQNLRDREQADEQAYNDGMQRMKDVNDGIIPFDEQFNINDNNQKVKGM